MNCKVEHYLGHSKNRKILTVDISEGGTYCSHWGLTDLYERCEKNLRDMLDTGVDFRTEWCGSKKELLSARYRRQNGSIWVDVNQWLDDLWEEHDLVYDAVWERFKREDIEIPEELMVRILDVAIKRDIDDAIVISEELGADASFEDCMAAVGRLQNATDEELTKMYETLCNIVEDAVKNAHLDELKGE